MKRLLLLISLILLLIPASKAQNKAVKKEPTGKWLFEAPYAPEGYKAGTIEIGYSENKYHASMAFSATETNFPGGNVKFANDTLSFTVFIQNEDVAVTLALTEETKMVGKAVYSEGIVPLTLIREKKKE